MADVKIVDIDGSQWEMKDQNARNKIATLEEKVIVKVTRKIDTESIKMNLVEINDEKFIQLHITKLSWSGNFGEIIANFQNDFGLTNVVRCIVNVDFSDRTGRCTADLDISEDGSIKLYPQIMNQYTGTYKSGDIYGDAFIKVTC